jgi:hypothetical protein
VQVLVCKIKVFPHPWREFLKVHGVREAGALAIAEAKQ